MAVVSFRKQNVNKVKLLRRRIRVSYFPSSLLHADCSREETKQAAAT